MSPLASLVKPALKFIHLRYFEDVEYNDDTTREEMLQNAGITIAYRQGTTHDGLDVAFSRCHPNDNYNKKVGRGICEGRMLHGDYYKVPRQPDVLDFEVICAFVNNKVMNDDTAEE